MLIFLFLFSCCDTTINLIGICDDLLTFCRRLPLCVSLHTAELSSKCVYVLSPFFRLKICKQPDLLRLPFFASHTALAWVCVCVCVCGKIGTSISCVLNLVRQKSNEANRTIENNCTQIQTENKRYFC